MNNRCMNADNHFTITMYHIGSNLLWSKFCSILGLLCWMNERYAVHNNSLSPEFIVIGGVWRLFEKLGTNYCTWFPHLVHWLGFQCFLYLISFCNRHLFSFVHINIHALIQPYMHTYIYTLNSVVSHLWQPKCT